MEIRVSDVIVSNAGHDKGKLFFVVRTEPNYVFIANGRQGRTIESPKKKKLMHVQFIVRGDSQTAMKLKNGDIPNNKELRNDLAVLRDEISGKNQGGK